MEKLWQTYKYIYGVIYRYYERLWGEKSSIVPFNVTLGLSFSLFTFLISIPLLLFVLFNIDLLFVFSNKIVMIFLLSGIVGLHYFLFEYGDKYKKIMKDYDKLLKQGGNHNLKKTFVFIYIFGSIVSLICLAILSTLVSKW